MCTNKCTVQFEVRGKRHFSIEDLSSEKSYQVDSLFFTPLWTLKKSVGLNDSNYTNNIHANNKALPIIPLTVVWFQTTNQKYSTLTS